MSKYENEVIRPILSAIETHQDFLCEKENLPQLAKLGYMFEVLWYAGRIAYGCNGKVKHDDYTCENNPKYELGDTIKYNSERNENLVYDAWGMHVSNTGTATSYDTFKKLILEGKPLSDFEIKLRKPNKTFDEWVEVLTDERYRYSSIYPDRRSVANHMLCVYGNGYGYNKETGMVVHQASGADQDIDLYGDWENSKFIPEIQEVVDKVLSVPECKIALDAEYKYISDYNKKQKKEELKRHYYLLPVINKELEKKGEKPITTKSKRFAELIEKFIELRLKELMREHGKKKGSFSYFPMCEYSILTQLNKNAHPSYIKVCTEICNEILANPDSEDYEKNKPIAEKFLEKFKS